MAERNFQDLLLDYASQTFEFFLTGKGQEVRDTAQKLTDLFTQLDEENSLLSAECERLRAERVAA